MNSTLGTVITTENQIGGILQTALTLFAIFKAARDKWAADHPNQLVPQELTDAYWIAKLDADSDTLIAHAQAIGQKYSAPDAPATQG
jgi:hypothetical protein